MTTDVEKKMQDVANGGYKAIVARHILHGQKQRQDRQLAEIIARTADKMKRLNSEELEHIELTVDAFIKRREKGKEPWVIIDAPESPANSTGIGGDCSNCGREDVRIYSDTSKNGTQIVDVCEGCLKDLL